MIIAGFLDESAVQFAHVAPQVDELIALFVFLSSASLFPHYLSSLPLLPPLPDEFNPEVPKLEKSVSGSSPSRDRLLLSAAMLLVSAVLLS